MQTALIVSLNFNPGHVSHMIASYKQCEDLGYKSILYVNPKFDSFLPKEFDRVFLGEKLPERVDVCFFLFPSEKNIGKILHLKFKCKSKCVYIFHEPSDHYSVYRKAGFTRLQLFKYMIIDLINAITVRLCYAILLPSQKALSLYDNNGLYKNKNRYYIPLMYDDELDSVQDLETDKTYFSYIGTIANDHSFNEFLSFVKECIKRGDAPNIRFMVATRSNLTIDDSLQKCIDSGRLSIIEGHPLTNEEINSCYKKSFAIWNAYARTTQSGVLAKSMMFGTAALVLKQNVSEFVVPSQNVECILDNRSYDEILNAIVKIRAHVDTYANNCRKAFLENFYYTKYNEEIYKIIK